MRIIDFLGISNVFYSSPINSLLILPRCSRASGGIFPKHAMRFQYRTYAVMHNEGNEIDELLSLKLEILPQICSGHMKSVLEFVSCLLYLPFGL